MKHQMFVQWSIYNELRNTLDASINYEKLLKFWILSLQLSI